MNKDILFDDSAKDFVLGSFGKAIDKDGYIVERDNPSSRVVSKFGREISRDDFGGIKKGSEIYFESDIASLVELCIDSTKG